MHEIDGIEVLDGETVDEMLHGRIRIIQGRKGYRFSIDAVLLAHFAARSLGGRVRKVIDLGTGSGIVPILLAWWSEVDRLVGVEIQRDLADRARRSVAFNGMEDRVDIVHGDVRRLHGEYPAGSFDVVLSNPPYRSAKSGRVNPSSEKAIARHEVEGTLEEILGVGSYLVKNRGKVIVIFPAARLPDVLTGMRGAGVEPKAMQPVYSSHGTDAKLVLVEGVKGAGVDLRLVKPIYIYDDQGNYTDEVERILGEEAIRQDKRLESS